MIRSILVLILLATTGCSSCTGCFTREVGHLMDEEIETAKSLPTNISSFLVDEFSGIKGIRRDFTIGTEREIARPDKYFDTVQEILCPCP